MKLLIASLLTFSILGITTTAAAQPQQDDILLKVNGSLTDMEIALDGRDFQGDSARINHVKRDEASINTLLRNLVIALRNENNTEAPLRSDQYLGLHNYRDLFELVAETASLDSIADILTFVKKDLALKFPRQLGSSTGAADVYVNVQVRVFDEASMKELPGYIPFVKPEWSVNPEQQQQFNPTLNAFKDLLPGQKLFWITKDGVRIQEKKQSVDIDGAHTVDFVVKTGNK
ncbi:hypothetical protein [Dinghuibacter silviterrae]|uniref:Uncharacterized protein n=1 Tax=Dinghuibacter silviterrae TaxID=1539049 RepID=A0A4R8DQ12_9BACT|nr:hypothetical protein [Dinghuibacter silviterrae]TDX00204.1 hypothetical protein EDB95_1222 [Dinghuibacter silviterrae]